jgi:Tol biopolymer transport system component
MRRLLSVALATLVVAVLLPVAPAQATYPGRNGRIAFHRVGGGSAGEIMTVRPNGSGEQQLTATPAVEDRVPSWSRDGARIAFGRYGAGVDGLWYMNADGSGLTPVPGTADGSSPAWSPDGTRLAYTCYVGPPLDLDICVINLDGSGLTHVTPGPAQDSDPVWSQDGTRLVFSRVLPTNDGARLLAVDLATLVTTALTPAVPGRWDSVPDWSPDGAAIVFSRYVSGTGHGGAVYTMTATGKAPTLVVAPPVGADSHCTTPVWSPDGKRIAYTYTDDDDAFSYVHTIRPDGTGNQQITFGPNVDRFPDWRAG